jgi:hypothetical protein
MLIIENYSRGDFGMMEEFGTSIIHSSFCATAKFRKKIMEKKIKLKLFLYEIQ